MPEGFQNDNLLASSDRLVLYRVHEWLHASAFLLSSTCHLYEVDPSGGLLRCGSAPLDDIVLP